METNGCRGVKKSIQIFCSVFGRGGNNEKIYFPRRKDACRLQKNPFLE